VPSRDPVVQVPVEALRAAAATRAAASSITKTARQIGLTTRGLNLFLQGSEPYSGTRTKLEAWFVREAANHQDVTDVTTALAALSVLAHDLPPDRRPAILFDAAEWWGEKYADAGVPIPAWVNELSAASTESNAPSSVESAAGRRRGPGRKR
jgi:hypothetical protein